MCKKLIRLKLYLDFIYAQCTMHHAHLGSPCLFTVYTRQDTENVNAVRPAASHGEPPGQRSCSCGRLLSTNASPQARMGRGTAPLCEART